MFHREKRNAVGGHTRIIKPSDMWMTEAAEQPLLVMKAAHDLVAIDAAPDELKCDEAKQPAVFREIDLAHAACIEERDDFVVLDDFARGKCPLAHHIFGGELSHGRWEAEIMVGRFCET